MKKLKEFLKTIYDKFTKDGFYLYGIAVKNETRIVLPSGKYVVVNNELSDELISTYNKNIVPNINYINNLSEQIEKIFIKDIKYSTGNFIVGPKTAFYKPCPKTEMESLLLKRCGLDREFECLSVGNAKEQIALIPTDDSGIEKAKSNAVLFSMAHEMFDLLLSFDNYPERKIEKSIWKKRNDIIARIRYNIN